ncbi:hypothetical protein NDU88_004556 [Pleurodeles waltl]|uniref:Uncharacterized protein n=1 Tax=Pleurodeles waltl TaxID=8319 RepID=A0AAV7NK47_PLEWA|nr:hypothetical protein NDU88_004556 [Pleurodeles waltl]
MARARSADRRLRVGVWKFTLSLRVVVKAYLVVISFGGAYELVMGANGGFEGGEVGCRGFLSPYFLRLAAFALGVLEFGGEPWGVLDVAGGDVFSEGG